MSRNDFPRGPSTLVLRGGSLTFNANGQATEVTAGGNGDKAGVRVGDVLRITSCVLMKKGKVIKPVAPPGVGRGSTLL